MINELIFNIATYLHSTTGLGTYDQMYCAVLFGFYGVGFLAVSVVSGLLTLVFNRGSKL